MCSTRTILLTLLAATVCHASQDIQLVQESKSALYSEESELIEESPVALEEDSAYFMLKTASEYFKSTVAFVRRNPLKALTALLALQGNVPGAAGFTVTNINQTLNYEVNGGAVQILPVTVNDTSGYSRCIVVGIDRDKSRSGTLTCSDYGELFEIILGGVLPVQSGVSFYH